MRIICSSVSRSVRRIGYIGLPAFIEILSHTHTEAFVHSSHIGKANYVSCVSDIQCVLRIATVRLHGCESIWRIQKEEIRVHACVCMCLITLDVDAMRFVEFRSKQKRQIQYIDELKKIAKCSTDKPITTHVDFSIEFTRFVFAWLT